MLVGWNSEFSDTLLTVNLGLLLVLDKKLKGLAEGVGKI